MRLHARQLAIRFHRFGRTTLLLQADAEDYQRIFVARRGRKIGAGQALGFLRMTCLQGTGDGVGGESGRGLV